MSEYMLLGIKTKNDLLHKITTYICKNHAKIVVENLNVSGMLSNEKLSRAISDCGFYEFKRQLKYKAKKFGCELIIADRWFASSKLCSTCGHKHESLTLKDRVYVCSNCGLEIDRDLNAALKCDSFGRNLSLGGMTGLC